MTIAIGTIKQAAVKGIGRGTLYVKKYSPEILTGLGIAGMTAGAILAARATLKLEETHENAKERIETVKDLEEHYPSKSEYNRDLALAHLHVVLDYTKLYGPSASLFVCSAGAVLAGHGIMRRRNVALVAAYNVLEKGFANYRGRVEAEFGADKDREFLIGTVQEDVKDPETGKKKKVSTLDPNAHSVYARWFDEVNSTEWQKIPEYNLLKLKTVQNYANDLLHARGHVFLNEVYDDLGLERSQAGAVVGWVLSKTGDNYVDFGIYDQLNDGARLFVNGSAPGILLDFNVDGVIYDKI